LNLNYELRSEEIKKLKEENKYFSNLYYSGTQKDKSLKKPAEIYKKTIDYYTQRNYRIPNLQKDEIFNNSPLLDQNKYKIEL
jgi:hypothetical protein